VTITPGVAAVIGRSIVAHRAGFVQHPSRSTRARGCCRLGAPVPGVRAVVLSLPALLPRPAVLLGSVSAAGPAAAVPGRPSHLPRQAAGPAAARRRHRRLSGAARPGRRPGPAPRRK